MNIPERTGRKEKGSSPALSLPTPPDSAEELSTSQSQSLSSSGHRDFSQPAQRAFDIIKSVKQGHGPENPWIKLHLGPSDFSLLEERLKVEDLWGYVEDKIRFDYDPQSRVLILRMPSTLHEIFTGRYEDEIKRQLQSFCENKSRPNIATLASSIECRRSADIYLLSDLEGYSKHSPDSSFQRVGNKFPSVVIETSCSQKKKDLPYLADNYIIGSQGNIRLVIGLDIEYRNSKKATVSAWECEERIEEDGVPYICAKKTVDNKPFRNDEPFPVAEDALVIPLSVFTLDEQPPDAEISILYAALKSFLKRAEDAQQEIKTSGLWKQPPPEVRFKKRQRTPEE